VRKRLFGPVSLCGYMERKVKPMIYLYGQRVIVERKIKY